MALATNIARRAGSAKYYARVAVPLDLVPAFGGKRELWKSLGTSDPHEAKRLVRPVLDGWDREFMQTRARHTMSERDIQEAVWNRYVELIEADERFRQEQPTDDELDEIWEHLSQEFAPASALDIFELIRDRLELYQRDRAERLATLKTAAARGDTKPVAREIDRAAKAKRLTLSKDSGDRRKLGQGLQRAELEALHRAAERDEGDFSGTPKDRLVQPPTAAPAGEEIMQLFASYARENPEGVKPDTLSQSRAAVEHFAAFVGPRFPVSRIGKKQAREWKELLLRYPVKAAESRLFVGLSLKEIVEKNEALPEEERKPAISKKTVNRYLAGLSAFIKWLVSSGYLDANPLDGMFIHVDKTKTSTTVFSSADMTTLFRSPLFVGCQSGEKMHESGNLLIRDHRYWLPLVMLFSGARPAEIAQLLVDDVREHHGSWIMHITEEGDETKTTKTKGSMRVVPIHPELIRLGFVDFVKAQKERGERRLFPEAERNARGQMAAKFSREFGRYLERIGIKEGRGLSLYSFRHGFIDALRRAEYLDEQFAMLVGHAKHTTTSRYGHLPEGMLRQRAEMIEAVTYPDLDLSPLYPAKT